YALISYEIIDSSAVRQDYIDFMISVLREKLPTAVYYNRKWLVVKSVEGGGTYKWMYNRKSKVLYRFYDSPDRRTLRVDSVYTYFGRDPALCVARDSLRGLLGLVDSTKATTMIKGFRCHKTFYPNRFYEQSTDELWVASYLNVPNLCYPENLYFLHEGLPMEIVMDLASVKFKYAAVDQGPVSRRDRVFDFDVSGYLVKVVDSKALIYE